MTVTGKENYNGDCDRNIEYGGEINAGNRLRKGVEINDGD